MMPVNLDKILNSKRESEAESWMHSFARRWISREIPGAALTAYWTRMGLLEVGRRRQVHVLVVLTILSSNFPMSKRSMDQGCCYIWPPQAGFMIIWYHFLPAMPIYPILQNKIVKGPRELWTSVMEGLQCFVCWCSFGESLVRSFGRFFALQFTILSSRKAGNGHGRIRPACLF